MQEVILTDGEPCSVRALGLYELDAVPFDVPQPYKISVIVAGGVIEERDYDLSAPAPERPERPEHLCQPGSVDYDRWMLWNRFLAAITRERERIEATGRYAHDVAKYVLENCISAEDRVRIATPEDLDKVLAAAIMFREVSLQDIEHVLETVFQGQLQWATYLSGLAALAARQRGSDLNPLMGSPDPASLAA